MGRRFRLDGREVTVSLPEEERVFLSELLEILAQVPRSGEDPASRRLRVPVYLDDPEANDEWWRLMGEELNSARNDDRRTFQGVVAGGAPAQLSIEEANAFLRVLNEGRLVLGARFGVEVEEDHYRLPQEQREILDYLGWLLEDLTDTLRRGLGGS